MTAQNPARLLITAGPTHEPIDAVRYLGNRSSGRLGVELAQTAAERGIQTRLLLGPTRHEPAHREGLGLYRFLSTADLQALLDEHLPWCDALVMAAAVADYRPRTIAPAGRKLRREQGGLTLELEPTPDLLARCAQRRRPDQLLVGFALEPEEALLASARRKLSRKGVDAIVANPLETMDAESIRAHIVTDDPEVDRATEGPISKRLFAGWLLDRLPALIERRRALAG